MTAPRPVRVLAVATALLLLAALGRCLTGCSAAPALLAELPAAAEGIVALVQHELDAAHVPPTDPAYVAALAGARAIEAEMADAGAQRDAKLDAILALVRSQARKPPPAAATSSSATSPQPLPATVAVRAGPLPDAGALVDGGGR